MYTVVVRSGFEPTTITRACDNSPTYYSYGPFKSFAGASRWACKHLTHIADTHWHIAQHIPIVEESR